MDREQKSKANILVVDDAEVNLAVLEKMLKKLGYDVEVATSVKQAYVIMETFRPQIILSDVSMPEIDGYEFCRQLKENPYTREIPVIFISGLNAFEDKIKGFEAGGVDFISKPFDEPEVAVRIHNHLKMYELQRQLENYNKQLNVTVEKQLERIEEGQKNILIALAKVTEGGKMTPGYSHLENVSYNVRILAQSMAFSKKFEERITPSFIDMIGVAALMHDIGKIAIPDKVLKKSETLTSDERELIKTHTEKGGEILEEIQQDLGDNKFIQMAIDIALYHHEKWDGNGYPYKLKGEEIPLAARIVSIVGVYDTLVHEQYYKQALSDETALQIIKADAGFSFDPDIVEIFCKIIKQIRK